MIGKNSKCFCPTPKKETPQFDLGTGEKRNSCEAAVVAMGVGSSLAVPSASAAVSAPASRCNGLKDMGEKRLFPRD